MGTFRYWTPPHSCEKLFKLTQQAGFEMFQQGDAYTLQPSFQYGCGPLEASEDIIM
jgi:hypothetical protein